MSEATPAELRHLPLERLEVAPRNVRATPAGANADAERKASIAAHGILQSLVVCPGAADRLQVVAGARRLAAAQALARGGVLAPDYPVPCRVEADGAHAHEHSLEIAEALAKDVVGYRGTLHAKSGKVRESPPKLFDLTALQSAASARFG